MIHFSTANRWLPLPAAALAAIGLGAAMSATAYGQVLISDTFGGVSNLLRRDSNGDFIKSIADNNLNGTMAEFPGNASAIWIAPDALNGQSWNITFTSSDPFEVSAGTFDPDNSHSLTATDGADLAALLPFTLPSSSFKLSLDVINTAAANSLTIGLTSSLNAVNNNIAQFGQAWLTLETFTGAWTLQTKDGGRIDGTTQLDSYNPLALGYDPVSKLVWGTVNGETVGTLNLATADIQGLGFEGGGTVNNFQVELAAVPEPAVTAQIVVYAVILGAGALAIRRRKLAARAQH
jgi:hypothetical protein